MTSFVRSNSSAPTLTASRYPPLEPIAAAQSGTDNGRVDRRRPNSEKEALQKHRRSSSGRPFGGDDHRRGEAEHEHERRPDLDHRYEARERLLEGDRGDDERGGRVEPPEAEEGVAEQPDEHRSREIRAQQILCAFASRRHRFQLVGKPALREPRSGILITLETNPIPSPIPSQLVSACRPASSRSIAS